MSIGGGSNASYGMDYRRYGIWDGIGKGVNGFYEERLLSAT